MLAYVFWHSAAAGTPIQEYVQRLKAFHHTLQESHPAGLLASFCWEVEHLPWLEGARNFEDWYVLENASYLDELALAAVSHQLRTVHDSVAGLAANGTAGLYKPARGNAALVDGPVATWFSKPSTASYDDLYSYLDQYDPSIAHRLWQRFLTLGPGHEFCAAGDTALQLPDGYRSTVVHRCQ